MLKAIECVYPVESPEPAGFAPAMTLRPYQRQSLAPQSTSNTPHAGTTINLTPSPITTPTDPARQAFMLDIERSTDEELVGSHPGEGLNADVKRLAAQRTVANYGSSFANALTGHQRALLNCAQDDLRKLGQRTAPRQPVRGGWLCDARRMQYFRQHC